MLVVSLTVSTTFDPKETRAYDILYRLHAKEEIKKKTAKVFLIALRLNQLKRRQGRDTSKEAKAQRHHLRHLLDLNLQILYDTKTRLMSYDIPANEILRQLREKIDRDLKEIKDTMASIEKIQTTLETIENHQNILNKTLKQVVADSMDLQESVVKLRFTQTNIQQRKSRVQHLNSSPKNRGSFDLYKPPGTFSDITKHLKLAE
jgi:seryl-tRNA synthetase